MEARAETGESSTSLLMDCKAYPVTLPPIPPPHAFNQTLLILSREKAGAGSLFGSPEVWLLPGFYPSSVSCYHESALSLSSELNMTEETEELAEKVVATFKHNLSEAAREQIREADFNELALMIREAISEELSRATDMVEEVVRKLRSETDKPEIGM
jgi:hypothetical protein